jgi:hypothetical protein
MVNTDSAPIYKSKLIVIIRVYIRKAIMIVFNNRFRERERNNSTYHLSSSSSEPGLATTRAVWLASLAESGRSDLKLRLI